MQLKSLFTDEDAVSPVIGVILMVAITVILAAVIGAFVLGIGSNQESAPQASFDFQYDGTSVKVVHGGGGSVEASQLTLSGGGWTTSGAEGCSVAPDGASTFSAGDLIVGETDGTDSNNYCSTSGSSSSLSITWTASSGDSSQIIAEDTVP